MKFCAVALLALLYFNAVYAHTIMTQIVIDGQGQTSCMRPQYPGNLYQYTSIGADFPISSSNLMSNGLTSNNYTCGFLPYAGRAASSKCTVAAGSKIGITYYHGGNYGNEDPVLDKCIARSHKGPFMAFLANSETGSGNVWFKIYQSGQINTYTGYDYEQVKWASPDEMLAQDCTFYFDIPSDIAPGNYLLRTEIIAMHDTSYHGAQPYVACTELSITGSGNARPAGVAIPGNWDYNHPGITYNIYDDFRTAYPFPGPAVYKAGSSATSASATSAAAATSASATSASATSASATSAAATSYSATTGYGSTTGAFQRINVRVTIRVNLAPSSIDITYLVYEITQVLGIPSSALSDVTIDLDQSKSSGPTVIEFIIWNDLKADGTRVNPVDAALRLQTMASNQDPTLQSTSYLSGMQVLDQQTQTDETAASSSSSGVSTTAIIAGAVVGGVVVVAGVAVGAYFIVKKKNNGGWM